MKKESKEILENILLAKDSKGMIEIEAKKEEIFNIIPELKEEDGFDQKHPHHCYDVWQHTVVAMQKSSPDLQVRLTLLLHDIGKPHSYQEHGEVRHFRGHPEISAKMAQEILRRLGYEEEEIKNICYLVANHDTIIDVESLEKNDIDLAKKLLHIQYCDAYAHAPQHIEKRIKKLNEIKEKLEERANKIQETEKER